MRVERFATRLARSFIQAVGNGDGVGKGPSTFDLTYGKVRHN